MKKIISILLTFAALVGVLGVFAISASAAESFAEVKELKGITLWNAATGEVINFDNGTLKNGTPVRCWALDGTGEQLWNIVKVSGTTYRLVTHKSSKYCLDVYRGSSKLKAGQKCDIWKTGDDPTAQNIVFTRCENGNYVIRMAADPELAVSAAGSKAQLKLMKYDPESKSQQWSIRDAKGNKLDTAGKVIETPTGIPADCYEKNGKAYTVDGVKYYEAVTLTEYNGVPKGSLFFVKENGVIVTDGTAVNKLYSLNLFENMRANMKSVVADCINAANGYYSVCAKVTNNEKLGTLMGKTAGIAISITAGNPFAASDAAIAIAEETLSPAAVKSMVLMGMLKLHSNNTVAYGTKFIYNTRSTVADYDKMLECIDLYSKCMASFETVEFLGGDTVREMSGSTWVNELKKYFKNVFMGWADSMIPNIASVEITKYVTDGIISLGEFSVKSGADNVYFASLAEHKNRLSLDFTSSVSVAEKLSQPMAIKFVKPLVSSGKTNVTTQKWGNKYSANGKYHLGVDLATNGGKKTTVVAITGGTVVRTMSEKASGGWGNFVIVEHTTLDGRKFYSGYGHLASIYVKVGDEVEAGSELGLMGSTGNSTGAHLHLLIFTGKLGKNSVPLGYTATKISGKSIKISGITYYNPLEVISSGGSIIK